MKEIERFDVVIRRTDDGYVAGVSDLGLYVRAPSAAAALAALEARRAALSEEIAAFGMAEPFPPARWPMRSSSLDALGSFAAKALIVFLLLTATLAGSGAFVISRALDAFGVANLGGGPRFWAKLEEDLHAAAQPGRDIPEAKKQQLLSDIRSLVTRWQPFVAEISPLFDREPHAVAPVSTSKQAE